MGYKLKRITIWRDSTRLPSEYQEVEYIQSSWTQYFIVWTSFKTSYKSVIDFQMTVIWWDYVPLWCHNSSPFLYRYWIDAWDSSFKIISWWNSRTSTISEDTNRHTITIDKNSATVDGINYNVSYTNATITRWIWVFWYNQQTEGVRFKSSAKLYKLDIYDENGTQIYDLVPCYRKSDSVIWMYDLINDVFYTNQGTGTFTKWNDVWWFEEKQVRPRKWHPWANTLAYYPFSSDAIDVIWNTSLSVSWTQETLGRSFSSSVMINTFPSTSVKTSSVWFKVDTLSVTGNVQIFILRTQPWCYMVKDSQYRWAFYMYKNRNYYAPAPWTQWQRTNLVITVANNYLVCYKDGVQYTLGNGTLQDAYNQLINITWTCNFVMSDLIFENAAWTQQEVLDYYNLTKWKYWL